MEVPGAVERGFPRRGLRWPAQPSRDAPTLQRLSNLSKSQPACQIYDVFHFLNILGSDWGDESLIALEMAFCAEYIKILSPHIHTRNPLLPSLKCLSTENSSQVHPCQEPSHTPFQPLLYLKLIQRHSTRDHSLCWVLIRPQGIGKEKKKEIKGGENKKNIAAVLVTESVGVISVVNACSCTIWMSLLCL